MRGVRRTEQGIEALSSLDGKAEAETEGLVPLSSTQGAREVTVYVKGFLGRGEEADHFEPWLVSHREAAERLGWGDAVVGYRWRSGSVGGTPIPFASAAKIAWDVYGAVSKIRKLNIASALAMTAGEQVARIAIRFAMEYRAAERAAQERAIGLAERLSELAAEHERVRVVAHSLGCRHVIEAVSVLEPSARPSEVHLCAPACSEADVELELENLARERTHLYFTPADLVLRTGFKLLSGSGLSGGDAIGASGIEGSYEGLDAWDVSEDFDFWVHAEYKRIFGRIAR